MKYYTRIIYDSFGSTDGTGMEPLRGTECCEEDFYAEGFVAGSGSNKGCGIGDIYSLLYALFPGVKSIEMGCGNGNGDRGDDAYSDGTGGIE